eukprot:scaffold3768_cov33-Tisochrysis_lutea.AAC.2
MPPCMRRGRHRARWWFVRRQLSRPCQPSPGSLALLYSVRDQPVGQLVPADQPRLAAGEPHASARGENPVG